MCSAIKFDFSHWKVIASLLIYVLQLSHSECSLLPYNHYWLTSKRIVTPKGVISGAGIFYFETWFCISSPASWNRCIFWFCISFMFLFIILQLEVIGRLLWNQSLLEWLLFLVLCLVLLLEQDVSFDTPSNELIFFSNV